MILKLEYNLDKDIQNYIAVARAKYKGGNSKVLDLFSQKFSDDLSEKNIKEFIKGFVEYNKINIEQKLSEIKQAWGIIEHEFIKRMNRIFNINFLLETITAYLTTVDRCTLGKNHFFVTVIGNRQKIVIMHELLHFYTFCAFKEELATLNQKQIYDIKEIITELLNLEFLDLMEVPEKGYPQHIELRNKFRQFWQEDKNIKNAFSKLIIIIKTIMKYENKPAEVHG